MTDAERACAEDLVAAMRELRAAIRYHNMCAKTGQDCDRDGMPVQAYKRLCAATDAGWEARRLWLAMGQPGTQEIATALASQST